MPYERETFAKIFVNGEYVGLYLIVEPIDKRFLLSWFGEDTGYLYEGHGGEIQYRFKYRGDDPNAYLPETVPNVIGDHDGAIRTDHRHMCLQGIQDRHAALLSLASQIAGFGPPQTPAPSGLRVVGRWPPKGCEPSSPPRRSPAGRRPPGEG